MSKARYLKFESQAELDIACGERRRRASEQRARDVRGRWLQIHPVEDIEEFDPELDICLVAPFPGNPGHLQQSEIGVCIARADERVASQRPVLTHGGLGEVIDGEDLVGELEIATVPMLGVPESRRAERRESVAVRVEVAPAIPDQVSACVQDRNERESASDGEGPAALKNCHSARLSAP